MRNKILREILSDKDLMDKYELKPKDIKGYSTTPAGPFPNKIVEVIATIINDNANSLTSRQIYNKLKMIHKI